MKHRRVLLDASVLYIEPVRGLLLWIAALGGFDPLWTARILDEVGKNLLEGQRVSLEQWERLRAAMLAAFPDAMLDQDAPDAIEDQMPNDPKDRHVLAAAVAHGVELVVTNNLKHFKQADLERVGVRALNADQLLCELLSVAPNLIREALESQAATMRTPRQWTVAELLGALAGLGRGDALAPGFADAVRERLEIGPVAPPPPD
jgi:hypothetical protein